ncbi:MAG: hypothetical protein HYY85_06540 [Deltaproteobacteria bacterium]|nr:hypothetical protein [Deltaproteobacteria bacterium]
MGKQRGRSGPRGRAARSKGRKSRRWWLAGVGVLAVAGGVLAWRGQAPSPPVSISNPASSSGTVVPTAARRETRPTLEPALFVGKAARTHQIAREIPDVLDRLYCYCECDKHVGHKSLLSCYTDGHAAT